MNTPVGILYFIPKWVIGGTEAQLLLLLRNLDRQRFLPHVCALYPDSRVRQVMSEVDVLAFSLNVPRVFHPVTLARLFRLGRYCFKHNIKVIQAVRTDQLAFFVGTMGGVRVILGGQRNNRSPWGSEISFLGKAFASVARKIDARLTGILANSERAALTRRSWSNVPSEACFVIHNGIDLSTFHEKTAAKGFSSDLNSTINIMIVGRLDAQTKGHFVLLDAIKLLNDERLHLSIVGDGPDAKAIRSHYLGLGLSRRVQMLGHRNDVPAVLQLADIVVVPSTNESSPNVILEAWAAQKPVIATKVGGVPELVEDGVNGLLVPVQNAAALANAISRLAADISLRNHLAINGRCVVENKYSVHKMATATMDLYDTLLAR